MTGGARGIGAAIAARFSDEGAAVLIADLRGDAAAATAAAVSKQARQCEPVEADVSTETGWDATLAACQQHFGPPDVLVNNAGINRYQPLLEETLDGWRSVLDANLTSVFLGMRAVIPLMAARGGGAIVNVSSTWGLVAAKSAAAYHASKGGVTLLTKNAAVTYAAQGIRVNSIHPGPVATPMLDGMTDEAIAVELAKQPLGRLADPDEIATAAVYLASDEASFVTGAALVVDGGYTARLTQAVLRSDSGTRDPELSRARLSTLTQGSGRGPGAWIPRRLRRALPLDVGTGSAPGAGVPRWPGVPAPTWRVAPLSDRGAGI